MIYRCEECQVSCFTEADPADKNSWPICHGCDGTLHPVDEPRPFWS